MWLEFCQDELHLQRRSVNAKCKIQVIEGTCCLVVKGSSACQVQYSHSHFHGGFLANLENVVELVFCWVIEHQEHLQLR